MKNGAAECAAIGAFLRMRGGRGQKNEKCNPRKAASSMDVKDNGHR
jgi:hypothetical protein